MLIQILLQEPMLNGTLPAHQSTTLRMRTPVLPTHDSIAACLVLTQQQPAAFDAYARPFPHQPAVVPMDHLMSDGYRVGTPDSFPPPAHLQERNISPPPPSACISEHA